VSTCETSDDILSVLQYSVVDMLITDLSMPEDGTDIIRKVRSVSADLPIIVVTGRPMTEADQEFIESFQPAQAAGLGQRHELRVDGAADRGFPADFQAVDPGFPDSHAAAGQEVDRHPSVIHADHPDAVRESALQAPHRDLEVRDGLAHIGTSNLQRTGKRLCCRVEQRPHFRGHEQSPFWCIHT
jgi:CheY-like chemotaxis protein